MTTKTRHLKQGRTATNNRTARELLALERLEWLGTNRPAGFARVMQLLVEIEAADREAEK